MKRIEMLWELIWTSENATPGQAPEKVSRLHGQILDEGDVRRILDGDVRQLGDNSGPGVCWA